MGPGLVAYDLTYFALATALYGTAGWATVRVLVLAPAIVPWPFLIVPGGLVFLLCLIAMVGALTLLCPRLKTGKVRLMKGTFFVWMVRSLLRRILFAPGLKWFLFTSNVLRFLTLRALGANVAFTANMSADVDVLDPSLLEVGPGAVIGARSLLSGHYVEGGVLMLGKITIGAKVLIAADVTVGPGAVVGDRATAKVRAAIGPNAHLGKGATLGGDAGMDSNSRVGDGADIGVRCYLARGAVVAAGEKVPALTHVKPQASSSAAPAV
jgi:carbonic anhydrase/acetyltransferase-like protein (isoleucine patch superfamily)